MDGWACCWWLLRLPAGTTSMENALVDMSNHGKGPLYDELRRVVVEIRMGKSLDESFNNMALLKP